MNRKTCASEFRCRIWRRGSEVEPRSSAGRGSREVASGGLIPFRGLLVVDVADVDLVRLLFAIDESSQHNHETIDYSSCSCWLFTI